MTALKFLWIADDYYKLHSFLLQTTAVLRLLQITALLQIAS